MNKLLTLNRDYEIKLKSNITKDNSPKYVYIPINAEDVLTTKLEIKKEEKITQQSISPISGKIVGTKYCLTLENGLVKCLKIQNDYKEAFFKRNASSKNLSKINLEKWIIDLKESGNALLASKIYNASNSSTFIIIGFEDEPYEANEIFTLKEYPTEILETIDALQEILKVQKTQLVLKNNDRGNIEKLEDLIGTYANIELNMVPDYYLLGKTDFIKKYLNISTDCLILKATEVKILYDVIKRHRKTTEHLFTVSGNGLENPQMIEAKLGSSINEIIKSHIKIKKNIDIQYIVNGLMTGNIMEIENLIVTPKLKSIMIMMKEKESVEECINCGKCVSVCPMNCNPRSFMELNKAKFKKNCIDCGLCSYICPSSINLRSLLKGDNNE